MPSKTLFGLILIFIGLSIFANLVYGAGLGQFWPVILIITGVFSLFQKGSRPVSSVLIIAFGVLFLLGSLNTLNGDIIKFAVPAVLVCLGLFVIFGKNSRISENRQNRISYFALMGCAKDTVKSQRLWVKLRLT